MVSVNSYFYVQTETKVCGRRKFCEVFPLTPTAFEECLLSGTLEISLIKDFAAPGRQWFRMLMLRKHECTNVCLNIRANTTDITDEAYTILGVSHSNVIRVQPILWLSFADYCMLKQPSASEASTVNDLESRNVLVHVKYANKNSPVSCSNLRALKRHLLCLGKSLLNVFTDKQHARSESSSQCARV